MSFSYKIMLQTITNIVDICYQKGIRDVILSPGSRSAPLTIAFAKHQEINTKIISDERVAAFVAMGIAQQTNKTVVLVCTSGSAALNYFPAVAEAFFQKIPLLIMTADRPPEWIDQLDGQTIRQTEIYGKHCKQFYQLPVDYSHSDAKWQVERTISEAINLSQSFPPAPVHINCPFREPFYPKNDISNSSKENENTLKIIEELPFENHISENIWEFLIENWNNSNKILIIGGQERQNTELTKSLSQVSNDFDVPVISDIISNLHGIENAIKRQDAFLGNRDNWQNLAPDLLITFGKSVISKNLKLFLRKYKPKHHWHIQKAGQVADTYQALTQIIRCEPTYLFESLVHKQIQKSSKIYFQSWKWLDQNYVQLHKSFFKTQPFSEFEVVYKSILNLPKVANLHLANSMSVRYANFINLKTVQNGIEVFANRGTSGIDGSTSTAIGHSFCDDKLTILITGDVAFFYDSNAFWQNYLGNNLRIILLNNQGGGIFKMIAGARDQKECKEYFVTEQNQNARLLSEQFGLGYHFVDTREDFEHTLETFFEPSSESQILEVKTDMEINTNVLTLYRKQGIK
jgi:2-succinyl-5-enolpyruvyl-6-hydroxy-3-cyclohexene-1-carboxylate synthase